jgi:hypothetical protein
VPPDESFAAGAERMLASGYALMPPPNG